MKYAIATLEKVLSYTEDTRPVTVEDAKHQDARAAEFREAIEVLQRHEDRIGHNAGLLYDTYCKAVGGVAFNGDPLPDWQTFRADPGKQKQVEAWLAVGRTAGGDGGIVMNPMDEPEQVLIIADAAERMAHRLTELIEQRDRYERYWSEATRTIQARDRSIASLRGQITKLRKRLAAPIDTHGTL